MHLSVNKQCDLLSNHSAVKPKQNNLVISINKETQVIRGGALISFIDQT